MSAPVLTKEQVADVRYWSCSSAEHRRDWDALCDSHEALRAERDAALAEVARLKDRYEPEDVKNHYRKQVLGLEDKS